MFNRIRLHPEIRHAIEKEASGMEVRSTYDPDDFIKVIRAGQIRNNDPRINEVARLSIQDTIEIAKNNT